ncbi:MAG: SDR family NAD(P)-dependent oxidoreductase [Thermoguttaceae bacterium]|nr:SDR family NAD(P)-dependent oxidoreductase [Thermoguttaceae bacterium]
MTKRPLAVVTGASDGMGREFARALAEMGCDLWIIARREARLNELKTELEANFGVCVEVVPADLSRFEDIQKIEQKIESARNLLWMVNCAGFGAGEGAFPDVNVELETAMLMVHNMAPMRFCRAALVPMRENHRGFIINVASVAGFLASRGAVDYSATKAFLITFSRSLQCDCVGTGVLVQAFCPGFVRTGFHDSETMKSSPLKEQVPGFLWDSAPRVVRKSIRAAQRRFCHRVVFIPTVFYRAITCFMSSPLTAPLRILFTGGKTR